MSSVSQGCLASINFSAPILPCILCACGCVCPVCCHTSHCHCCHSWDQLSTRKQQQQLTPTQHYSLQPTLFVATCCFLDDGVQQNQTIQQSNTKFWKKYNNIGHSYRIQTHHVRLKMFIKEVHPDLFASHPNYQYQIYVLHSWYTKNCQSKVPTIIEQPFWSHRRLHLEARKRWIWSIGLAFGATFCLSLEFR